MRTVDSITAQYLLNGTREYDLKIQIIDETPFPGVVPSEVPESYIYLTDDDFIYITDDIDDFIYVTDGYSTITQNSGTIYPLSIEQSIQPSQGLTLGAINSSSLTFALKDTVEIPRNAKLGVYTRLNGTSGYGDWIPLGYFYVDNRYPNGTNIIKYICYDEIIKSEVFYVSALSYPTTAQAVWDEIIDFIGGTTDTVLPIVTVPTAPSGDTARIALSDITAMCGGSLIINDDGNFDMVRFCDHTVVDLEVGTGIYSDFKRVDELVQTITKVTCIFDEKGNYVSLGSDDGYNLIFNCRLINDVSELTYVYNLYNGLEFVPYSNLSWIGDPRVELGDLLGLVDNKTAEVYPCYVMNNEIKYGGGLSMVTAAPIKSIIQSEFDTQSALSSIVRQTQTKVTQNTTSITSNSQEIVLNATQIGVIDGRVTTNEAEIVINAQQISLTVSEVSSLDGRVTSAEASIVLNSDQIALTVTEVGTLDGRVTTAESSIIINSDNIALKVSKDGIIAAINISPEVIQISAAKINLTGYVTITNLATSGTTTINGGNITTGTIQSARLSTDLAQVNQLLYIGTQSNSGATKEVRFESGSRIRGGSDGVSPWLTISSNSISITDQSTINLGNIGTYMNIYGTLNINGRKEVSCTDALLTFTTTATGLLVYKNGSFVGSIIY